MIIKLTIKAHIELPDGATPPAPDILDFVEAGLRATVPNAIGIMPGAHIDVRRYAPSGRSVGKRRARS